jgi:serine/threonine protein kinase
MTFKNQGELFDYIWESRPHISELSGKPLLPKGHFKWHWQFLHILPKGSYPHFKLNPENILLGLPDEHDKQDDFEIFRIRKSNLKL